MKFKEGDFVKYAAPTGSIGRIEALNNYGGYYVRWTYGRDVKGEEIKSSLSSYEDHELIEITQELYEKVRDGEAFKGDRQFEKSAVTDLEAKLAKLESQNDRVKSELAFTMEYLNPVCTSFRQMIDAFKVLPKDKQEKLIDLLRSLLAVKESK